MTQCQKHCIAALIVAAMTLLIMAIQSCAAN